MTAGYQYVGAGSENLARVFERNASIDLNERPETAIVDHALQVTDFLEGVGDKFLATESGIDAHDQNSVEILQNIA